MKILKKPPMQNQFENLSRNEFLKSLGFKGASLLALYCLGTELSSCTKGDSITPSTSGVDFTIDLSTESGLNSVGSYIIKNNIVVAKTGANSYVAATKICPHENRSEIIFQGGGYFCTAHEATFNTVGSPTNNITNRSLITYNTSLSGTILRVFS